MQSGDVVNNGRVRLRLGKLSAVSQRTSSLPEQKEYLEAWEGDKTRKPGKREALAPGF